MAQSCRTVISPRNGFLVERIPTRAGSRYGNSITVCTPETYAGILDVFAESLDVYLTCDGDSEAKCIELAMIDANDAYPKCRGRVKILPKDITRILAWCRS
jgi:hypothetical protein